MRAPIASPAIDVDDALLRAWPLPALAQGGDKEARGRLLIVAGSAQMPGAAILAAQGALRAGAGKVTIAIDATVAMHVAAVVVEARVVSLAVRSGHGITRASARELAAMAGEFDAGIIGPGMQDEAATAELAQRLLEAGPDVRWILDAYAMTARAAAGGGARGGYVAVTPNAGDMAHLQGISREVVHEARLEHALTSAKFWQAVVALKGPATYVAAPDGRAWRHTGGNIGLAVSGAGDALAGIIGGIAVRGGTLEQASVWGVAAHARAGDRLAQRIGTLGYLAREISGEIPAVLDLLGANVLTVGR